MKRAVSPIRETLRSWDRMLLGAVIGWLAFASMSSFLARVEPPPVDILDVDPVHPVLAGERMTLKMTALVRRRCAATADWSLIDAEGRRVWLYVAERVGYTQPRPEPITVTIFPLDPLPADLRPGEYTLVVNRTDRCPDRQYVHEPRAFAVKIP